MKAYFVHPFTLGGLAALLLAVPFGSILLGLVGVTCILAGVAWQALVLQRGQSPQTSVHLGDLSPQARSQLKPIRESSEQILRTLNDRDAPDLVRSLASEVKNEVEVVERYGYQLAMNRTSLERVLRDSRQIVSSQGDGSVAEAAQSALAEAENRLSEIDQRMEEARTILGDLALRISAMHMKEMAGAEFTDETLSMVGRLRALNATIDEADTMMRIRQS